MGKLYIYTILVDHDILQEYQNYCASNNIRTGLPVEIFMASLSAGKIAIKDGEVVEVESAQDVEIMRRQLATNRCKKVACYKLPLGELYKVFDSTNDAAEKMGVSQYSVRLSCSRKKNANDPNKSKAVGGYFYRYIDNKEEPPKRVIMLNKRFVNQYTLDGKYITTFMSSSDAGRNLGIPYWQISAVLRGDSDSAGGFLFRPYDENPELNDLVLENDENLQE